MEKLEFFKSIGFTEYESKTIKSLLKLNASSTKQISENSGVPQNKLYQILKKFICLGIVAEIPNKRYQIVNFTSFINEKILEKEMQLKQIVKLSKEIKSTKTNEEFSFQLIKGQIATMNKIIELNENSKKEIIGVQRNWKVWGNGLRVMNNLIKKKVRVRMIGVINKETEKRAREWKNIGCKIKFYNKKFGEHPLRFTIFDNKIARVTLGKPEIKDSKDYITIITTSEQFIDVLKRQFLEMWKKSENF
jgi:sugar-specific transcriptional regulator TrmB